MKKITSKKAIVGIAMTAAVVFYGVFMVFPVLYGFCMSFFNWNPFKNVFHFTGIDNYIDILKKAEFWEAIKNTLVYTIGTMVLTVGISLFLAAMLQSTKKSVSFYRGMYFLPVVSSGVATAMLWKFLYNYNDGFFNAILMNLGLDRVPWLMNSKMAMISVIIMSAWKDIGYALVLIMAGINDIDPSVFDSAAIDGCNKAQQFFRITLPLIRNSMTILIITRIIDYMQVYTPIKFITEGGPGTSTQTIAFYIYEEAFTYHNFGSASAISFILFIIIFAISMVQMHISGKNEQG